MKFEKKSLNLDRDNLVSQLLDPHITRKHKWDQIFILDISECQKP
jgi:hypothetical protein